MYCDQNANEQRLTNKAKAFSNANRRADVIDDFSAAAESYYMQADLRVIHQVF